MMVAPVLAGVLRLKMIVDCRWLGECYIGGEKIVWLSVRGGLIFEAHCAYSKVSPLPSLDHVYY